VKLKIEINMDNAAFGDGDAGAEVARILRRLADKYESYGDMANIENVILDINGNKVGRVKVTGRRPSDE
jgi:O-succinylbenzoate synthase